MGTTRTMRLTSCAASLTRSITRCGVARTEWNRRTWPTGWPYAVGNWLRVSWSTSPISLISRAVRLPFRPEATAMATAKHQGACGGRDKHEQSEHVVVADDQIQPAPGELDRPVVAPVRREKQPPARQQLVADRQRPPAKQAHHQRDAEDPVAEAPWPVRGENKCRHHVHVVVRPANRGHQEAGRGTRHQAE